MNFKRKLKLNSLGVYKFSIREDQCLDIIFKLNIYFLPHIKFNDKQISYLYKLMNLKFGRKTSKFISLDYENENYLYVYKDNDFLDWDYTNVHRILLYDFKLKQSNLNEFLKCLIKYAYKDKIFLDNDKFYIIEQT